MIGWYRKFYPASIFPGESIESIDSPKLELCVVQQPEFHDPIPFACGDVVFSLCATEKSVVTCHLSSVHFTPVGWVTKKLYYPVIYGLYQAIRIPTNQPYNVIRVWNGSLIWWKFSGNFSNFCHEIHHVFFPLKMLVDFTLVTSATRLHWQSDSLSPW